MAKTELNGYVAVPVSDKATLATLEKVGDLRKKANETLQPVLDKAKKWAEANYTLPEGTEWGAQSKWGKVQVFAADIKAAKVAAATGKGI